MIPRQYRIHVVLMLAAAAMIIIPLINEKPDEGKARLAQAAAQKFLALIDQGQYAESWQAAAAPLKGKITQQEWESQLAKARTRSGALVDRQQKDISYDTMAADSPDGEYIVLQYASRFKNREALKETVTVMLEKDHAWRVAGYFMQ